MHFTSDAAAKSFFEKLGLGLNGSKIGSRAAAYKKSDDLFYQSGAVSTKAIASALASSQGSFSECVVWPFDFVWGDRSQEAHPPGAWTTYAEWRRSHGETRALRDAPGHVFSAGEESELKCVLDLAICMGWNAFVAARPVRPLIELSHDDRISIHARTQQTDLVSRLNVLGVWGS